jgi:hypothetical protein
MTTSVRFVADQMTSLKSIDEIVNRGDKDAFVRLLQSLIEQPNGPIAERVRTLYERVKQHGNDPECLAWPHYQATYWLVVAMGEFR